MSFLERIRSQPQHVRGRYAFLFSISLTAVVGIIWATTLPARFSDSTFSLDAGTEDDVRDVLFDAKDQFANTVTAELEKIKIETNNMQQLQADSDTVGSTTATYGEREAFDTQQADEASEVHSDNVEESSMASSTIVTEPAPAPRVILIGTTTVQNSE